MISSSAAKAGCNAANARRDVPSAICETLFLFKGIPPCKKACKIDQNFSVLAQSAQYVAKPGGVQSSCLCTTSNLTCPLHAFAINFLCRLLATMKNDPLLRNFEDDLPLRGVPAQDEIAGVTASSLRLACSEAHGCDRQLAVDLGRWRIRGTTSL